MSTTERDVQTRQPNVIWIFGDQHRGQCLGCMGDPDAVTPNVDRMATEGLHFTHAVSGGPTCTPFRGSLLTSRYTHECAPQNGDPIPEGMPTISTVLRQNGYQTCYLGKWHLAGAGNRRGGWKKLVPEWQRADWDEWIGYDNNNAQWNCWVHGGLGDDFFHYKLDGYETDVLTDMLLKRIEGWGKEQQNHSENARPFFAVLSVQPPHDPCAAPEEWTARFQPGAITRRPNIPDIDWVSSLYHRRIGGYHAQVANLDHNVGRVRQALLDNDLFGNTYIFFFSDHGDMLGSHARFNKSVPHEESIRIPMVIAAGHRRVGQLAVDHPINHVDIAPTTLGFCGIEKPADMRGFDYSPLWRQRDLEDAPDSAFVQECGPFGKIHPNGWRAIVTRDGWKYAGTPAGPWLLFNVKDDPYEMTNLVFVSHYFEKRRELHGRLREWIAATDDDFDLPELTW